VEKFHLKIVTKNDNSDRGTQLCDGSRCLFKMVENLKCPFLLSTLQIIDYGYSAD